MLVTTVDKIDVDTRFLLANDRTLLAWVRTALAIEAGGLVLLQVHNHHSWLVLIVVTFGALIALIGYSRYREADRAIRAGRLPHAGIGPAIEVGLVVLLAIGLAVAELLINK